MKILGFSSDVKLVGPEGKFESPEHGCNMAEPPDGKLPVYVGEDNT